MGTVRHYHHHYHFTYNTSLKRHVSSLLTVLFITLFLLLFVFHFVTPQTGVTVSQIKVGDIISAALNSLFRMLVSYAIAIFLSVPLSLLITASEKAERVFLPIFDIVQSVPVLAFFPVIILTFVKFSFLDGAAIFILVVAMMGSLVFSMIGGLKTIPQDIYSVAKVFGITGRKKLFSILLPAILPNIISGSLLAWSQGWSIMIVAESLHPYIPGGNPSNDLFGLGSLLVNSFAASKNGIFLAALATMIIVISVMNYFIWQKLLHYAERFKFD